jgi:cysteine desulfurase/selenocysteine lyase
LNHSEWVQEARNDFPLLKQTRNGKPIIYFDSACTSLVPLPVIESLNEYYTNFPGCSGTRSRYWIAREVTRRIEGDLETGLQGSRQVIQKHINARSSQEIIFTFNTTHALNILALGMKFNSKDTVLLTDREHNSNLIPWLRLQKKGILKVNFLESRPDGTFDLNNLYDRLSNNQISLLSLGYTSNLTGETLPAREVIRLAHEKGALVILDAAQTAPHQSIDVQDLDVDFLAFSIHKMCGPKGVGILYGKKSLITGQEESENKRTIESAVLGGGTVNDSTYQSYSLLDSPERFEAGVQNYAGQIAAGAAIKYLQKIGIDRISRHEQQLNSFLTKQLLDRYGDSGWFHILGPPEANRRGSILTFEIKRPNAVGIADEMDERSNIMIRDGAFCVHSYLNKRYGYGWGKPQMPSEHRMIYRISLYLYNTLEECEVFLDTLHNIFEERGYL